MPDRIEEIGRALQAFEEEQQATLREAAAQDPPIGAPYRVQLGRDPNEVELIEPGQWEVRGYVDRKTGLPPNCPVIPLSREGQVCKFIDTMGSEFELDAKSSGKGPIGALFGGRSRWLEWAWPRYSKGTEKTPPKVIGWQADDARQALVDACSYMGSNEYEVRGRGAWLGDNGELIYHAGDAVLMDKRWVAPGEYGECIYTRRSRIGRPSERAQRAAGGAGQALLEKLQTFNWDRPDLEPRLALGWVMTAKVGGALDRRPVLFVHGGEGSGKSTLQQLLRGVMNGALIASAEATQAGIYHHLRNDSVAILVDELEAKDDSRVVDKILALARIAYSGDKMHRGGKDGVGKEFTLHSSFLFSAVNKPATEAQDDSRMAIVMLRERERAGDRFEIGATWAEATGRHLLRRWFDWWPRWPQLLARFREEVIAAGHSDRSADTFAPLAAASHVALSDEMPTSEEFTQWRIWLDATQLSEVANRERTWRRCYMQLLNAPVEQWRTYTEKSVGALLNIVRTCEENGSNPGDGWLNLATRLPGIGMAISWAEGDPHEFGYARLFVPANHPAVGALFAGSTWAGRAGAPGPWCNALRQAPRELWMNGKCDKGLDHKASGILIHVKAALDA